MGSIQSTPSVVGGTVAASLVVGALFYSAQNPEPAPEQPQPSSSSKKTKKKKKPTAVDDVPAEKGTITPPAITQSANLFAAPQPQQLHDSLLSVQGAKSKKKNKAKSAAGDSSAVESGVESSAPDAAVGGGQSGSESTKAKKKKKSKAKSPLGQDAKSGTQGVDESTLLAVSMMDQSGLGPWTHVETRRGKSSKIAPTLPPLSDNPAVESSDAGVATSVTEESQDQDDEVTQDGSESAGGGSSTKKPDNVRTLAEKMLPKPRKTGVDDMLETSDFPSVARVMRVTSGDSSDPPPQKAPGVSWGDYEDADELADGDAGDDEGWDLVTRKPRTARPASQHDPLASSMTSSTASIPGAPTKLTKHQKQGIARRESQKQAKAEAETDRLERLAKHKKELEKARIEEQYKKSSKTKVGGGMSSSVQNGALVWE